jgi:hypothetical protein
MLRSLYCAMLRLHPAQFRARFAEEMLSIFDEAQELGNRTALGLLADGLRSLARQWVLRPEAWDAPAASSEAVAGDDVPTFYTIDPFRPRAAAVIQGVTLSLAVFFATCFAIRYSWIHVLHVRIPEVPWNSPEPVPVSREALPPQSQGTIQGKIQGKAEGKNQGTITPASRSTGRGQEGLSSATAGSAHSARDRVVDGAARNLPGRLRQNSAGLPEQRGFSQTGASDDGDASLGGAKARTNPAARAATALTARPRRGANAASNLTGSANRTDSSAESGGAIPLSPETSASRGSSADATAPAAISAGGENEALNAADRQRVVESAIANVEKYYFDPKVAGRVAYALRAHEERGDDEAVSDPPAFADLLTSQMRKASGDEHLVMIYERVQAPERPLEPTAEELAQYREEMRQTNCRFEKVEILAKNIGYIKLNGFPDPEVCQATATAAMAKLNGVDALIFDLRDNRGGASSMVALIATYLFDRRTHLNDFYDRGRNSTEESWTLDPIPGNRLADKPVYVLTSSTTFSAAEGFSYDLKMLKRATLVGETTSGRGHMGMGHRIDAHFTIRVPGIRVTNPISKTNWEGKGVEPDVKVKAADALATAEKLAGKKIDKEASHARD